MREQGVIWVLLALVAAATALAFVRVQDIQRHQNDALRSIICYVDAREQSSPTLTALQKRQAGDFWRAALQSAHLPYCFPTS